MSFNIIVSFMATNFLDHKIIEKIFCDKIEDWTFTSDEIFLIIFCDLIGLLKNFFLLDFFQKFNDLFFSSCLDWFPCMSLFFCCDATTITPVIEVFEPSFVLTDNSLLTVVLDCLYFLSLYIFFCICPDTHHL